MSRYSPNFLGVHTRRMFTQNMPKVATTIPPSCEQFVQSKWPPVCEEYFEWIDLLEAVCQANQTFTMIELGAGYGRWLVNAAAALRQRGHHDFRLIGVEAEPTHFQWMKLHFAENGLDPNQHWLIEAAIATHQKGAWFSVGRPDGWYGQSVVSSPKVCPATQRVKTVTLDSILARCDQVDLLDLDIQGLEYDVLAAARKKLHRKVKRVHIGTHNQRVEDGLRKLFSDLGWIKLADFSSSSTVETFYGRVSFQDGVQSWLNPYVAPHGSDQTLAGTLLRRGFEDTVARIGRWWRQQHPALRPSRSRLAKNQAAARARLREKVYAEYPQLSDQRLDDWQRVTLLRQWAWSHIRLGGPSNPLHADPSNHFYDCDVPQLFEMFDEDRGGVYCSGAALALQRLYELFGYQTWCVSTGESNIASHASTLVKIRFGNEELLPVQDAYFNLAYTDSKTGAPLDYFDLLARLTRREHASIRTSESDYRQIRTWPALLVSAKDRQNRTVEQIARATFGVLESDYQVKELPDGSLKIISPRTGSKFIRNQFEPDGRPRGFLAWLVERGHLPEIIYLYLYPYDISGPDGAHLLARAKAAAAPAHVSVSPTKGQ